MRNHLQQTPFATHERDDIMLSTCVMGRNEARHLPRRLDSLTQLDGIGGMETILVDSASEDASVRTEIIPVLKKCFAAGNTTRGIVDICWHQYPDGTIRERVIPGNRDGEICRGFGGAVVWPRTAVLAAGNWNPNLNAYEESELYGRLRALGCEVLNSQVAFVDHPAQDQLPVCAGGELHRNPRVTHGLCKYHGGFQPSIADHWQ